MLRVIPHASWMARRSLITVPKASNLLTKHAGIDAIIQIMGHAPNCSYSPDTSGWTILTNTTTGDATWPSSSSGIRDLPKRPTQSYPSLLRPCSTHRQVPCFLMLCYLPNTPFETTSILGLFLTIIPLCKSPVWSFIVVDIT
jgi:hypothetical protein